MEKKRINKVTKIILIISIILIMIFLSVSILIAYFYNKYDLDVNKLTSLNNGVRVYSATGIDSTLYNTNRSLIEIDEIPEHVKKAFIDTEDKRFYSHNGYDIKRIIKAGLVNLTTKSKSQGASTISQQLIKNALLTNEKTYSRKIKEIVLSSKMEKQFSKDEILEMYLNTIYFGSNAYGIENASRVYFNKSSKELTINEACCLAGLIKSPNKYSPRLNYDNAVSRRNVVAKLMYECKDISKEEYEDIINSPIELTFNNDTSNGYEVEAIHEACRLLNISERELINRGYEIITYKDDTIQDNVENANKNVISETSKQHDVPLDSVSIVADNSGKVVAYFVNSNYDLHNMKRQPASTLKPFAVYLPCIIHNILTPATPILDEEIDIGGFSPNNADNKFRGYVSTRESIAHSLNIPAVKALDYVGLNKSKEVLTDFGFNIDNADLNLSLALGATKRGCTLMQLVNAYSCLSNGGIYKEMAFVDKILDRDGNTIYSHEDYFERVATKEDAFLITNMLEDSSKTGTARRLNSLSLPIASKTGTTNNGTNNTDLFNVSYTPDYTTLSWIANIKDNALPKGMYSSVEPTEINKNILKYLYSSKDKKEFDIPEGIEYLPYDTSVWHENHLVVTPNHNLDRYIAYDYFKIDNKPAQPNSNDNINIDVQIDKLGSIISFDSKKYANYNVYKENKDGKSLVANVCEKSGKVELIDKNIFKHDEITYYIENDLGEKSNVIKVRPKDYLIGLLNNELSSGKKRWSV